MPIAVYCLLLFCMLLILYHCGKTIAKTGKIMSFAGLTAIMAYTLNEGLRFGRGVDFNLYGQLYETILIGGDSDREWLLLFLFKTLQFFNVSYQGFIILTSFLFVIAVLVLLKNYREIIPFALPLCLLLTLNQTENLIRWYLGFSFILIGTSYLSRNNIIKFFCYSIVGCGFHLGLLPIPFIFLLIHKIKGPLLPPFISIPLFIIIGLFFQVDFMLRIVDVINIFSHISDRAARYADNSEYWLTGGFSGLDRSAFPGITEMAFMFLIIWLGYKNKEIKSGQNYLFAYNLFLIGFLFKPIANQIELLYRYDYVFLFFEAIICAKILYEIFLTNSIKRNLLHLIYLIVTTYVVLSFFKGPILGNPDTYLYVWNKGNKTYDYMIQVWEDNDYNKSTK